MSEWEMSEYTKLMVRNRLVDLPLQDGKGDEKRLPDDAIDYLLDIVQWAVHREVYKFNQGNVE